MAERRVITIPGAQRVMAVSRPDYRQKLGGLAALTVLFYGPQSD
ncbi:MAG: hypothetical protein P8172_14985 [Gammaproteobacteria bacterium]|jgi:hypothetical protein